MALGVAWLTWRAVTRLAVKLGFAGTSAKPSDGLEPYSLLTMNVRRGPTYAGFRVARLRTPRQ